MARKTFAVLCLLFALAAGAKTPLPQSVDWLDKNNGWGGLKFGMSVMEARALGLSDTSIPTTDAGNCYDKIGEERELGDVELAVVMYCFDPALKLIMILPLAKDDSSKLYDKFVSILGEPVPQGVWNGRRVRLLYKHGGINPSRFEMEAKP